MASLRERPTYTFLGRDWQEQAQDKATAVFGVLHRRLGLKPERWSKHRSKCGTKLISYGLRFVQKVRINS